MKKQRIGWIGLGNMGTPMALNLLKAGFDVTVYNRTEGKEQPLQAMGAKHAATIHELVNGSDVIIPWFPTILLLSRFLKEMGVY